MEPPSALTEFPIMAIIEESETLVPGKVSELVVSGRILITPEDPSRILPVVPPGRVWSYQ
jgi:hypothetical protein